MRILLTFAAMVLLIGVTGVAAGNPIDVPQHLVQIESRPGVHTRMLVYRPDQPLATVILFPDGSGRLDITHVFNTPQIGRSDDLPLELIGHLLHQKISVVLMDVPSDHRSILGFNGWHGHRIFRLSPDHVSDISAAVDYLRKEDTLPIWLAGIRMGGFSAANAAIHLQQEVAGLVIAGGITRCPEQKTLLKLCPNGLMGMPLHQITVPTLILSDEDAFPEALLTSALSQSPAVSFQTYPEFADFETTKAEPKSPSVLAGLSNDRLSREMTDFMEWNERINPILDGTPGAVEKAPEEIYLAGIYF